ncbi:MAG: PTS sugar transporter subunit IIB [Erysipelotrichaceae bacterium]|jgi:PTS system cellobiose-specific IIB component|nr:PTS sugar transporter subunit IIB [Erysipelotrichaceae bacterium]
MSKKITLFCSAGMSTSLLVNKMKEEAQKKGADYEIAAYSLNEVDLYGPQADVILVGPQVRFALEKLKKQFPDKPIDAIDMRSYGLMDGKAAIALAEKLMGE